MVPRFPLFILQGPAEGLAALPELPVAVRRPAARGNWQRKLSDLDELVWGRRRDIDHRFWLREPTSACRALEDGQGRLIAYVYFWPDFIGPLAARTPRLQLQLLRLAGETQVEAEPEAVRLQVPGMNATVLRALLEQGFRIDHVNLIMTSRSFGRFDRYLPSGGVLL